MSIPAAACSQSTVTNRHSESHFRHYNRNIVMLLVLAKANDLGGYTLRELLGRKVPVFPDRINETRLANSSSESPIASVTPSV